MRKFFILLIFASFALQWAFCAPGAFYMPLEDLVGAENAVILRKKNEPVIEIQNSKPGPRLVPKHDELRDFVNENIKNLAPGILIETLSVYRIPSPREGTGGWSQAERNGLFNQLTAISTLAGIKYYSESQKSMKIFYETSNVTDGPDGKKNLPDPKYSKTPEFAVLFARQKDLTFGDNIYRFNYRSTKDIYFMQENLTALYYGIIPVIGKNNLKTVVAVIDTGDSLMIYTAAMAKTASIPGMGSRIAVSFTNRLNAILKWFSNRADVVFVKG